MHLIKNFTRVPLPWLHVSKGCHGRFVFNCFSSVYLCSGYCDEGNYAARDKRAHLCVEIAS